MLPPKLIGRGSGLGEIAERPHERRHHGRILCVLMSLELDSGTGTGPAIEAAC